MLHITEQLLIARLKHIERELRMGENNRGERKHRKLIRVGHAQEPKGNIAAQCRRVYPFNSSGLRAATIRRKPSFQLT